MNTEKLNKKIVSGCESLAGKALTIDHDARTYHIGDRVIPFSSCVIKEGKIYYLTPMCKVLVDMGFKTVGLVTIDDRVFIKITLNSGLRIFKK